MIRSGYLFCDSFFGEIVMVIGPYNRSTSANNVWAVTEEIDSGKVAVEIVSTQTLLEDKYVFRTDYRINV